MSLDDPELVRVEYASETGLAARESIYRNAEGPDPRDVALSAVARVGAERVLEVGCGWGQFSERLLRELEVEVIALDLSARMVELARARGVEARVGDAQDLAFDDGAFDCVVANWVLYHLPDLDRGLLEICRVLRTGGHLVAATNADDHLLELHQLLGTPRIATSFNAGNGAAVLKRFFSSVERIDVQGWVTFPDHEAARRYVKSMVTLADRADDLPPFSGTLRARRTPCVFVAQK